MTGQATRITLRRLVDGLAAVVVGNRSLTNKVGARNQVCDMHECEGVYEPACRLELFVSAITTLGGAFEV